jgi:non-specific serine/threonine protein kinase
VTAYEVLANLNFQLDHYAEAADAYAEVAQRYARVAGPAALRTLTARLNTAMARQYAGHPADAEREIVGTLEQARSARPETDPLVQNLRYHLADCRLDQHHTEQVAALLTDLSAQALNASQIAADWDGRLAYQRGRLALESGDAARAVPLLETAATIIAEKHPDGRISEAQIRQLIERAKGTRITASR